MASSLTFPPPEEVFNEFSTTQPDTSGAVLPDLQSGQPEGSFIGAIFSGPRFGFDIRPVFFSAFGLRLPPACLGGGACSAEKHSSFA